MAGRLHIGQVVEAREAMSETAVATLQIWDCRWSRPGYRLTGVGDEDLPEPLWVCARTGGRRLVSEKECETCPNREYEEPQRNWWSLVSHERDIIISCKVSTQWDD
jgi:hypothetical protein